MAIEIKRFPRIVTTDSQNNSDVYENSGKKEIKTNGDNIDVTSYAKVKVAVPASAVVSGTKSITSNGSNIDVTNYAKVDVNVQNGYSSFTLTAAGSSVSGVYFMYLENNDLTTATGVTTGYIYTIPAYLDRCHIKYDTTTLTATSSNASIDATTGIIEILGNCTVTFATK